MTTYLPNPTITYSDSRGMQQKSVDAHIIECNNNTISMSLTTLSMRIDKLENLLTYVHDRHPEIIAEYNITTEAQRRIGV